MVLAVVLGIFASVNDSVDFKMRSPLNLPLFRKVLEKFLLFFLSSLFLVTSCQSTIQNVKNLNQGTGEQVIAFGDSITQGFGLPTEAAFPSVLSQQIGMPILNRGRSGDTTESALLRLQTDVIAAKPWIVIVGLGGNDFLRKVAKTETEKNLRQIVQTIQDQGAIVVLLGMNLGYFKDEYKDLYQRVAQETQAYLIPQILDGVLDNPQYRQDDYIHPNQAGQVVLATKIAKALKPLLTQAKWPPALVRYRQQVQELRSQTVAQNTAFSLFFVSRCDRTPLGDQSLSLLRCQIQ